MTIVEVVIAVAVLMIVLLPATGLVMHAVGVLGYDRAKVVATDIATTQLSQLTGEIQAGSTPASHATTSDVLGGVGYSVHQTVSETSTGSAAPVLLCLAQVSVTWGAPSLADTVGVSAALPTAGGTC